MAVETHQNDILISNLESTIERCAAFEKNGNPLNALLDLQIPLLCVLLREAGFVDTAKLLLLKAIYLKKSYLQLVDDASLDAKVMAERDARDLRFEVQHILEVVARVTTYPS